MELFFRKIGFPKVFFVSFFENIGFPKVFFKFCYEKIGFPKVFLELFSMVRAREKEMLQWSTRAFSDGFLIKFHSENE